VPELDDAKSRTGAYWGCRGRPTFNVILVVALLFNSFLFLCAQDIFNVWGAKVREPPTPTSPLPPSLRVRAVPP
jgi:hypothetical protein